jgi:hypothetical protein
MCSNIVKYTSYVSCSSVFKKAKGTVIYIALKLVTTLGLMLYKLRLKALLYDPVPICKYIIGVTVELAASIL